MPRQSVKPIEIPFKEWLEKGCPPLKLTVSQLAIWLQPPVSRQRVNKFVHNESIIRDGGLIDTSNPRNLDFIKSWSARVPPVPGVRVHDGTEPVGDELGVIQDAAAGDNMPQFDIEKILDAINSGHLRALNGSDVQKVQRLESALKTRVEREAKRGVLIDRRLVQVVFGKLWQVDSNQWKTLSAKLSADIAGEFGVEDIAVLLKIEQRIDKEVSRILSHTKVLINNFLTGVGGKMVE